MQVESQESQISAKRESRPFLVATATIFGLVTFFHFIMEPAGESARRASRTAQEVDYVKAADHALIMYMGEHGDRYPDLSGDMIAKLRPFIKDPKVIEAMPRFVWNYALSGKDHKDIVDPNKTVMLYSVVPGTASIAVGTTGGFAQRYTLEFLPELVKRANALKPLPGP